MAATALPPSDLSSLQRFLAEASGAKSVEIAGLALLPGGAIQENWGLDAEFDGGPHHGPQQLVLRRPAPTGNPASLRPADEFAVLQAVFAAGVTVAEPLWACADPAIFDRPFYLMRRLAGSAQGRWITTDPALEPALPRIAERLGQELARLQTIHPPRPDLAFLKPVEAPEHIAAFRAYLDSHPQPRPVLEWAIRWLETHLPDKLPPVLCHRDFRTGNYMVAPALPSPACAGGSGWGLTGILDWEFAAWGDPDEDIGWFCCKGWRFARLDREAGGIAGREAFYAGYETASGRRLDPERVFFWEVLANIRWAVIALQQSDRYRLGGARDLSTAIIGRRATECELELLILLDPAGTRASCPRAGGTPAVPTLRDLPSGAELLDLGRELLFEQLLPLLPPERQRDLRLVATAMAIAAREAAAGQAPVKELVSELTAFYPVGTAGVSPACRPEAGGPETGLLRRFAADLRGGAFETSQRRERAARAILWQLTMSKLREGNPAFLAANGFGE